MFQKTIEVREGDTIQSMIELGKYKHVKADLPSLLERRVENNGLWLASLHVPESGRVWPTSLVMEDLYGDSWIPADPEQLLMFGALFPDEQKKSPITAFGQEIRWEVPTFLTLGMYEGERKLGLRSGGFDWIGTRFLKIKRAS